MTAMNAIMLSSHPKNNDSPQKMIRIPKTMPAIAPLLGRPKHSSLSRLAILSPSNTQRFNKFIVCDHNARALQNGQINGERVYIMSVSNNGVGEMKHASRREKFWVCSEKGYTPSGERVKDFLSFQNP